jgi:hypothetical protein
MNQIMPVKLQPLVLDQSVDADRRSRRRNAINPVEGYQDHYEFHFGSDYITPFIMDVNDQCILDIY